MNKSPNKIINGFLKKTINTFCKLALKFLLVIKSSLNFNILIHLRLILDKKRQTLRDFTLTN